MFSLQRRIAVLLLSMAAVAAGVCNADLFRNSYDVMNDYLSDQIKSRGGQSFDNPLEPLKKWLESEEFTDVARSKASSTKRMDLIRSLKQILELPSALEEGVRCTLESHRILSRNDLGLDGSIYKLKQLNNNGPMNTIRAEVKKYASKHSDLCRDFYPGALNIKKAQMDEGTLKAVQTLTDNLVGAQRCERKRSLLSTVDLITGIRSIGGWCNGKAAYDTIKSLGLPSELKALESGGISRFWTSAVDSKKLEALIEKYLLNPCSAYVNELTDILTPAEYDIIWLDYPYHSSAVDADSEPFLRDLANFALCRTLVRDASQKLLVSGVTEYMGEPDKAPLAL